MADTSSTRHNLPHTYGKPGCEMPGTLSHGGTAQSVVHRTEILAEAEVAPAAVRRADKKPARTSKTTTSRKTR